MQLKLSSIDQPAGHIICGFILAILGAVGFKFGIPHSEEAIVSGFTIIGMAMRGLNGSLTTITPANATSQTSITSVSEDKK